LFAKLGWFLNKQIVFGTAPREKPEEADDRVIPDRSRISYEANLSLKAFLKIWLWEAVK